MPRRSAYALIALYKVDFDLMPVITMISATPTPSLRRRLTSATTSSLSFVGAPNADLDAREKAFQEKLAEEARRKAREEKLWAEEEQKRAL